MMVFFVLSIAAYVLQNIFNKEFGRRFSGVQNATLTQNGLCVSAAALVMLAAGGFRLPDGRTMLLAALFGATYLLTVFLLVRSMEFGSMGGSVLLCNIGMFLSTLYGVFVCHDVITVRTALGMLFMLAVVLLSTPRSEKKGGTGKNQVKWFWLALGSGLMNGVVASIKRTVATLDSTLSATNFLFWGFLFAAVTFGLLLLFLRPAGSELKKLTADKKSWLLCGIGAGAVTAGGNLFQMLALRQLSSVLVYPLTSGLLVLLLWGVSLFGYREVRVEWRNIAAIGCCLLGLVLNSLP